MSNLDKEQLYFRNYKPLDPDLKKLMLPKTEIPKVEINIDTDIVKEVNGQIDLTIVAPRRDTADLKRLIQDKVDKLDRRTERALEKLALKKETKK